MTEKVPPQIDRKIAEIAEQARLEGGLDYSLARVLIDWPEIPFNVAELREELGNYSVERYADSSVSPVSFGQRVRFALGRAVTSACVEAEGLLLQKGEVRSGTQTQYSHLYRAIDPERVRIGLEIGSNGRSVDWQQPVDTGALLAASPEWTTEWRPTPQPGETGVEAFSDNRLTDLIVAQLLATEGRPVSRVELTRRLLTDGYVRTWRPDIRDYAERTKKLNDHISRSLNSVLVAASLMDKGILFQRGVFDQAGPKRSVFRAVRPEALLQQATSEASGHAILWEPPQYVAPEARKVKTVMPGAEKEEATPNDPYTSSLDAWVDLPQSLRPADFEDMPLPSVLAAIFAQSPRRLITDRALAAFLFPADMEFARRRSITNVKIVTEQVSVHFKARRLAALSGLLAAENLVLQRGIISLHPDKQLRMTVVRRALPAGLAAIQGRHKIGDCVINWKEL